MPSPRIAIAKLRWSLHKRGLLGTLRTAASVLTSPHGDPLPQVQHPFDVAHGVETGGMITAVQLASGLPNELLGTGYSGVPPSRFHFVMDRWTAAPPERPVTEYSFIDIGCGKGRALMLGTAFPFREIIGVELNADLIRIAAANLDKWHATHPQVPHVRLECRDATQFDFPSTPCLLYLYNPFAEPILKLLLRRIDESFTSNPRPLDVLHCNPDSTRLLDNDRSYTKLWSGPTPISEEDAAAQLYAASQEVCHFYRRV